MRSLLILSLVLTACGGGSGTSAQDEEGQDDTEYGEEAGAPAGQATAAPAGSDTTPVSDLTKKRRQATFKVTYQWSSGKDAPANETWYSKPPRSRIDFGDASQSSWMSQFILENGVFVCETSSGKAACWKSGSDAVAPEELSFTATLMTAYEGLMTEPSFKATRETRTIAGQQGSCVKSSDLLMLGLAEITLCYAGNGVPLLFQWKAGADTFTMEAKSYSTSVSDKDFELLATPQDN
jgi:hypothetical protein